MIDFSQLVKIIEGALFAADEPLTVEQLADLFEAEQSPDKKTIRDALSQLQSEYEDHGICLKELASGFQFEVRAELSQWVRRLQEEKPPRYSRALLETLALIAYRQPITRGEIEEVRGVAVNSNIIKTLSEREWIKVIGHRDVPGKPALLGTTKAFLDYFGLKQLDELPTLAQLQDLDQLGNQLAEQLELEENQDSSDEATNPEATQDEVINETEQDSPEERNDTSSTETTDTELAHEN